jgi:hypothetical protein
MQQETAIHDFDFLVGRWKVHHRRLNDRLAGSQDWVEFDGTTEMRKVLGGHGNMDDNVLNIPGDPYRAVTLRAFDDKTMEWSIWWLDGRTPSGSLEPAVRGRFKSGVGEFYADDTFKGRPIRVRFIWSHITSTSARWEQAFSPDQGKTWEVDWIMDFERIRES